MVEADDQRPGDEPEGTEGPEGPGGAEGQGRGYQILLCDDSPVERMALAHYLRREGYRVDEAGDGASAVEYLKNRQVDVLLLDLHMPAGADGFDVLKYVQQQRRSLPVILLSGMPPNDIQSKMHHLPKQELPPLLIKPVDPQALLELIALQLSGEMP